MHFGDSQGLDAISGDFLHGPQHVFWTCSYQMDKSRDMSMRNEIPVFGWVKMRMDGLPNKPFFI